MSIYTALNIIQCYTQTLALDDDSLSPRDLVANQQFTADKWRSLFPTGQKNFCETSRKGNKDHNGWHVEDWRTNAAEHVGQVHELIPVSKLARRPESISFTVHCTAEGVWRCYSLHQVARPFEKKCCGTYIYVYESVDVLLRPQLRRSSCGFAARRDAKLSCSDNNTIP